MPCSGCSALHGANPNLKKIEKKKKKMISVIQCNKDSYCEHIAGGVNMYLYECVRLLALECAVCLCVLCLCVCVILKQSAREKTHCVTPQ